MLESLHLLAGHLHSDDADTPCRDVHLSIHQALTLDMLTARGQLIHRFTAQCVELQQAMWILGWRP